MAKPEPTKSTKSIWCALGKHLWIVGVNGSGKSIMLMEQCRHAEASPVIIYNTKHDTDFYKLGVPQNEIDNFDNAENLETVTVIKSYDAFVNYFSKPRDEWATYIVVNPTGDELADYKKLDDYLKFQYENIPSSYAAIDELLSFHNHGKCERGLLEILTRGRSRGISAIMCCQRPVWCSVFCQTESKKVIVYRLQGLKDRKLMEELTDMPKGYDLPQYWFWFYELGDKTGTLFKPIPLRIEPTIEYAENETDNNQELIWL